MAGCLAIVSHRCEALFLDFLFSGLGLIPEACNITVGYGLYFYASKFISCFPYVYEAFSDVIVLGRDFKNLMILTVTLLFLRTPNLLQLFTF